MTDAADQIIAALRAVGDADDPQPGELARLRARCARLAKVAVIANADNCDADQTCSEALADALDALHPGDLDDAD